MSVQIIEKDGQPEYAILPYDEYRSLLEKAEELDDIAVFDGAVRELAEGRDELIPGEIVDRLLAGENAVRVWRQYRELTQAELAARVGLAQSYVAMVERGERSGSVQALRKMAAAVGVDLDALIDEP